MRTVAGVLFGLLVWTGPSLNGQTRVNPQAVALKEFADHVKIYVELHRRLKRQLPALPEEAEAAQIDQHQKALAQAIRAERKDAKLTNLFTTDVREALLPIIRSEFQGPGGKEARETVKEGNPAVEGRTHSDPPVAVKVAVNEPYPTGAPLSTAPAGLLAKLPALPPELEYRFVGRHLILLDIEADLVVDFIKDAVPN